MAKTIVFVTIILITIIATFTLSPAFAESPTIKITKNATNADGAFSFTIANATNPSNSTLVNIPNTAINNMTSPLTVLPGNYSVTEIIPAGWTLENTFCVKTPPGLLVNPLNFNVTNGDSVECVFENMKLLATINGLKFNDTNGNGIQESLEEGVEGVAIRLYEITPSDLIGTLIQNVTSGFDGSFNFTNVDSGSYRVDEKLPPGTVQLFPANGGSYFIGIQGSSTVSDINFGNNGTLASEIRGMKFNDTNRNGIKDLGENGIPNIRFTIWPNYQVVFTDSNGNYRFQNLSPGTYSVYESFLSNTVFTTPRTQTVSVGFNEIAQNVDFGDTKTLPLPPDMNIPNSAGTTSNDTPAHSRFTNLVIQKTITVCTPVEPPLVTMSWPNGVVKTSSMTNVSGNLWEAVFPPTNPGGTASMRVDIDCSPDTPNYPINPANISGEDAFQLGDIVFLDPSGRILDICTNDPIEGATVTLLKEFPPGSGNFILPSTDDHLPIDNPLTTLANGSYAWDVTPGNYTVTANKTGFVTTESFVLEIPPPVTGLDISLTPIGGCSVDPTILNPTQDSFLRSGAGNTNEGANPNMIVRASGNNRALVSFNTTDITGPIDNATLRLFIVNNADNWGKDGRPIDVHRVTETWVEGDGANMKPGNLSNSEFNPFKNRGNGEGITWKCSIDSEINNQKADCDIKWNGGTFVASPTDSVIITKGLTDQFIEFDVTDDIAACITEGADECSWIVKKPNSQAGRVEFASKEGSGTVYDPETIPQLIIN